MTTRDRWTNQNSCSRDFSFLFHQSTYLQWDFRISSAVHSVWQFSVFSFQFVAAAHVDITVPAMSNRSSPYDRHHGRNTHQRRASSRPSTPADLAPPPPIRPPPSVMADPNTATNRSILVIVDFSDLARLARTFFTDEGTAYYYRMLHPGYYDSCNSFETESLYNYCQLILARDVQTYTMPMLMTALVEHILMKFRVEVDPATIELRFSDLDGEMFRVNSTQPLVDVLDTEFPMWRSVQQGCYRPEPIQADIDYPFVARFSCYVSEPGNILP